MPQLYFPDKGQNLANISHELTNSKSVEFEEMLRRIENANPKIKTADECVAPQQTILVPDTGHFLSPTIRNDKVIFDRQYYSSRPDVQALFRQLANHCDNALDEMVALSNMMSDYLGETWESYQGADRFFSDTVTGTGAAGLTAEKHANFVLSSMDEINQLLVKYANVSGSERHLVKQQILAAYKQFNNKFGKSFVEYLGRTKNGHRSSTLGSPRLGMKTALGKVPGSKTAPLYSASSTRRVFKIINRAKWLGRGVVGVDLGLRAKNVYGADNKWRELTRESFGFVAAAYAGNAALTALVPVVMFHPVLGVVLLLVVGLGSMLLADQFGKEIGGMVWDSYNRIGKIAAPRILNFIPN